MTAYKTSEVAKNIGIHPNTVRLYEKLKLIPKPERLTNGYRVFTDFHIEQCRLIRVAFQVEVLQNGLRKKMVQAVKASATGDFDMAILLVHAYLKQIRQEQSHAEEAIEIVRQLVSGGAQVHTQCLKRKEVSGLLDISMDALRNWEMNGLLTVKRKNNGYRVYTDEDIQRLKIIRSLRHANYSLEAILRLLQQLSQNPNTDIRAALNTPKPSASAASIFEAGICVRSTELDLSCS
nr:MerR family transcriptional regulator [bacterium]